MTASRHLVERAAALGQQPFRFIPNPSYSEACKAYNLYVGSRLQSELYSAAKSLMGHPQRDSRMARVSCWHREQPPLTFFRINFSDAIVEDILCTPQALADLRTMTPLRVLRTYAQSPTVDLWTREQSQYVVQIIDEAAAVRDACQDTIRKLSGLQVFQSDALAAALTGSIPDDSSSRLHFVLQFHAQAPSGWFECPQCGNQVADLPHTRNANGEPVCVNEVCQLAKTRLEM